MKGPGLFFNAIIEAIASSSDGKAGLASIHFAAYRRHKYRTFCEIRQEKQESASHNTKNRGCSRKCLSQDCGDHLSEDLFRSLLFRLSSMSHDVSQTPFLSCVC